MRIQLFTGLLLLQTATLHAQKDSTDQGFIWGVQAMFGFIRQDLSELDQYEHLLRPSDFSIVFPSVAIALGNPERISASLGCSVGHMLTRIGTYNNQDVEAHGSSTFFAAQINVPLRIFSDGRFAQKTGFSIGATNASNNFISRTKDEGPSANTLENSKASNILGSVELMRVFGGRPFQGKPSLILKIGYNFQFTPPSWTGTRIRNSGIDEPYVNLGGPYVSIGVANWMPKGMFRSWFGKQSATNAQ